MAATAWGGQATVGVRSLRTACQRIREGTLSNSAHPIILIAGGVGAACWQGCPRHRLAGTGIRSRVACPGQPILLVITELLIVLPPTLPSSGGHATAQCGDFAHAIVSEAQTVISDRGRAGRVSVSGLGRTQIAIVSEAGTDGGAIGRRAGAVTSYDITAGQACGSGCAGVADRRHQIIGHPPRRARDTGQPALRRVIVERVLRCGVGQLEGHPRVIVRVQDRQVGGSRQGIHLADYLAQHIVAKAVDTAEALVRPAFELLGGEPPTGIAARSDPAATDAGGHRAIVGVGDIGSGRIVAGVAPQLSVERIVARIDGPGAAARIY